MTKYNYLIVVSGVYVATYPYLANNYNVRLNKRL